MAAKKKKPGKAVPSVPAKPKPLPTPPPIPADRGQLIVEVRRPSGKAQDGTDISAPIAGADVEIFVGSQRFKTGVDGRHDFGGVTPGLFRISVTKAGFGPVGDPVQVGQAAVVQPVRVDAGGVTTVPVQMTSVIVIKGENGTSAPCDMIPVSTKKVKHQIKLKAVPSGNVAGSFQWATASAAITLQNPTSQVVTVVAGENVSGVKLAESLTLIFTPSGAAPLPTVTHKLTVFRVVFADSPANKFGFDDMDNEDGVIQHLSVKQSDSTEVQVLINGGVLGSELIFDTDDTAIASATPPPSTAQRLFNLTINGKNKVKAETLLRVRCPCNRALIAASLAINVYKEKLVKVLVAKVADSTSASSALTRPDFDVKEAERFINKFYKLAVVKLVLTDKSSTGGALNVPYDLNKSGRLDVEAGSQTSPELVKITKAFTGTGQKLIIIREFSQQFFLAVAAKSGDKKVTLKAEYGGSLAFLTVGQSLELGDGTTSETVKIKKREFNVFTLDAALGSNHSTKHFIRSLAVGLGGNPILMSESAFESAEKQAGVMGHEIGHAQLLLDDLDDTTNVMHFSTGNTDNKLRFKIEKHHHDKGKENQWEKIVR